MSDDGMDLLFQAIFEPPDQADELDQMAGESEYDGSPF